MKTKTKKLCFFIGIFLVLIAMTFSPLVIPPGESGPWLLGMPRTLWMGILISFSLAFLTLGAAMSLTDS